MKIIFLKIFFCILLILGIVNALAVILGEQHYKKISEAEKTEQYKFIYKYLRTVAFSVEALCFTAAAVLIPWI